MKSVRTWLLRWVPSPCEYLLRKLALISIEGPFFRLHFRLDSRSLLHTILRSSYGRGIIKQWLKWIFDGYVEMQSFQISPYPNASYCSICLDTNASRSWLRCSKARGLLSTLSATSDQMALGNSHVSGSVIVLPER